MQSGGVLKSVKSKNVANGLKVSEKVAEVKGSTVEWYKTLQMVTKCHLLSSFVILECKSSQIIAKVSHKCCTCFVMHWFVMHIGDMGSHQCRIHSGNTMNLPTPMAIPTCGLKYFYFRAAAQLYIVWSFRDNFVTHSLTASHH